MLAVKIRNLNFSYTPQIRVLKNLFLDIEEGRYIALAGKNGSGKTTLLKHLNGLILPPNNSEIEIFGNPLGKDTRKTVQKLVGVVAQNPDDQVFFPIVKDDIAFGPRNQGKSQEEVKKLVDEALKATGTLHLKDRITSKLSFGEKKRVAISGIIAMKPRLLVLDEPTLGIDPWGIPELLDLIDGIRKERTILVATHDPTLMKRVDNIAYLTNGKIETVFPTFEEFARRTGISLN
ncbi:MAG: energy-coupling factor ABC transporter ATP-binding protein [Promethearchaeota archaeon]